MSTGFQKVQYGPLQALVKAATGKHTATVIFAHGLGDTANGWAFLPAELRGFDHVKYIFPTARSIPITVNFGMTMTGWYDITALGSEAEKEPRKVDIKGIEESVGYFRDIIKRETEETGLPSERIVVGGFSQGSVISLITGLTTDVKLAGVAVMSGYLAHWDALDKKVTDQGKAIPYFWGHGTDDPVVLYSWAERSRKILEGQYKLSNFSFNSYRGLPHSASPKELKDLESWLKKVIPA